MIANSRDVPSVDTNSGTDTEYALGATRNTGEMEAVYNFEVEGFHTYHIGELGVWVHNDVCLERLNKIMNAPRPNARHPELQKIYNELFRPVDARPGGSAGELIREVNRGDPNPTHLLKVEQKFLT